jgi:hypothetical protein
MARERRFTVRLATREMQSIKQFAEQNHVITSVALRRLVEAGLLLENQAGLPSRPDEMCSFKS